jgi:RHS repeat-associated protein
VTLFLYDGNNRLQETDETGLVEAEFTYIPLPYAEVLSQHRDMESSFYLCDGIRNIRQLTDDTQAITDEYSYDAFGNLRSSTGSSANSQLYKGHLLSYRNDPHAGPDTETSTHFRNQSAQTGRFTSEDPAADDHNLYRLVGNNPVNKEDPSGLAPPRSQYYEEQRLLIASLRKEGKTYEADYYEKMLAQTIEYDRSQSTDYIYGSDAMKASHSRAATQLSRLTKTVDSYTLGSASIVIQVSGDIDDGIAYAANSRTYYHSFSEYQSARIKDEWRQYITSPLNLLVDVSSKISGTKDDPVLIRIDREKAMLDYREYRINGYDPGRDPGRGKAGLARLGIEFAGANVAGTWIAEFRAAHRVPITAGPLRGLKADVLPDIALSERIGLAEEARLLQPNASAPRVAIPNLIGNSSDKIPGFQTQIPRVPEMIQAAVDARPLGREAQANAVRLLAQRRAQLEPKSWNFQEVTGTDGTKVFLEKLGSRLSSIQTVLCGSMQRNRYRG